MTRFFFSVKLFFLLKLKEMFLPNHIADLILEFLLDNELLEWIDATRLCRPDLSSNPHAIHLLQQNTYKINWHRLSLNSAAIHLLE